MWALRTPDSDASGLKCFDFSLGGGNQGSRFTYSLFRQPNNSATVRDFFFNVLALGVVHIGYLAFLMPRPPVFIGNGPAAVETGLPDSPKDRRQHYGKS